MTDKEYEKYAIEQDKEYLEKMVAIEQERVDAGEWTSGISIGVQTAQRYLEMEKQLAAVRELLKRSSEMEDSYGEYHMVVLEMDLEEVLGNE